MRTAAAGKRIVVLSDNEGLSRAIEFNLNSNLNAEVVLMATNASLRYKAEQPDMMVVAVSSPTSEPVVELSRACLAGYIGRVPLLIISDRPFESKPRERITHLDFPFDVDGLHNRVEQILHS
jgi:hypothetical protein